MHIQSLFFCVFIYIHVKGVLAARTAAAFIHEDDGMYGSVVFHQWSPWSPVVISLLFNNIKLGPSQRVDYNIHSEPVHYDLFGPDERCGEEALKSVFNVKNRRVGELGQRHRMITGHRFAEVAYDWHISLYEGSEYSIIGKSFVIRQGDNEADYKCATINLSDRHSLRPGTIPCEKKNYADCLVGTERDDVCVFRTCSGYRQYWGPVDDKTVLCKHIFERYPKPLKTLSKSEGVVSCVHDYHSLLSPVDDDE